MKRKNAAAQEVNVPACVSCYLGVTEPAIFGVNLPKIKPFVAGMIGSACGAFCCFLFNLAASGTGVTGIFGLLLCVKQPVQYIIMFVVAFGATWGPLVWVLLGEMFPNRIRAGALAVAAATQWVANFFIFTTFPTFSSISLTFAYGFYAACALLSLVFVFFRAPETKGKELEEMEDLSV